MALKKFLGVELRTPNDLVYGETNRYPIYINSAVSCIRYWLKLLKMTNDRLPKKAYNMLVELDVRNKNNWASKIRLCLNEMGFGYAWLQQGVGNENVFVKMFRQRLIDTRWQTWDSHTEESSRFSLYRLFKPNHLVCKYLQMDMVKHLQFMLTRFRFGVSELHVHAYRYRQVDNSVLLCPLCKEYTENEVHFVLTCPALSVVRERFIPKKYFRRPSLFKLCLLVNATREKTVYNFALYLYHAFKIREVVTS